MSQDASGIDLGTSLGYQVKVVSSVLRSEMEAALRPLGMTITHYSCLELLSQRAGLSNSDLARGTFVTRQSMNVVLQSLESDGLVSRLDRPVSGRVLPTELTSAGRERLRLASAAVKRVEDRMTASFSAEEEDVLRDLLSRCARSLREDALR